MTLLLMAASATAGALFGALAVGIAAMSAGRCRHCDEDVSYTVNPGGIIAPPKPCERVPGERVVPLTDVNREALGQ